MSSTVTTSLGQTSLPKKHQLQKQSKLDRIYKRDKGLCWICLHLGLNPVVKRKDASLDHLMPQSTAKELGWSWDKIHHDSNLRLAHKLCNTRRGNQDMEAMFEVVDWFHHPASEQRNSFVNKPKNLRYK